MKTIFTLIGILSFTIFFSFCKSNTEEPKELTQFITEMADARMMDREEGRLAMSKGTTKAIRDYGSLMVKDQTFLLEEMKQLAASKNIMLPTEITKKKMEGLEKLKEKEGTDFDKKFLSMIKIDHKRDVKKFKKAAEFTDEKVQKFALTHLPMIQSHLVGATQLKKNI